MANNYRDLLCRIRQMVTDKDLHEIEKNALLFIRFYEETKRQVTKFCKDDKHQLIFGSEDLIEIADETKIILNTVNQRINVRTMIKNAMKPDKVDDNFMALFTETMCSNFYIAAKLTEFHSVICYLGCLLHLLEMQYEQGELDFVSMDTIKKYLGK